MLKKWSKSEDDCLLKKATVFKENGPNETVFSGVNVLELSESGRCVMACGMQLVDMGCNVTRIEDDHNKDQLLLKSHLAC